MQPKEHYTAKHFKRYARKEFPDEFALFQDLYVCNFENKTYLDENHAAHNVSVLLVGHYYTRKGGSSVWAQATSTCVRYYQGKAGEAVCTPVPEEHVTRIYYSAPYSSRVGAQAGRSKTAGKKVEHYFAETIVNVVFLLTGRLEQISNPGKTDMLSNFRYVCMNTVPKPEVRELVSPTVLQQPELLPADDAVERKDKKRKRDSYYHGQRIKQEDDIDAAAFAGYPTSRPDPSAQPWNGPVQQSSSHSPMPYRLARETPQTSLLDQLRDYEADMTSKLEQEKRARFSEIQALQVELEEQELRAQAAEEKLFREKKKRKSAEEQVEDLKTQAANREEKSGDKGAMHTRTERGYGRLTATMKRQREEINKMHKSAAIRNRTIEELREALAKKA